MPGRRMLREWPVDSARCVWTRLWLGASLGYGLADRPGEPQSSWLVVRSARMFPFDTYPLYASALAFVAGFGLFTFPSLFFVTAPYGRHARPGWGPTLPAKWGWVVMEAPSPLGFAGLWLFHYVYRSFVFPFLMRGGDKRKPLVTVGLAVLFNCANGPMNAFGIVALAPHLEDSAWLADPRFLGGVAIFFVGWAINQHADHVLRNLRKPGESGYKIPHGGLFAGFTFANLFPRALDHHKWYRGKFDDYPKERKAIVPFLI